MAKPWTDAEFEVVEGPYRPGDPHRDRKKRRWRFVGWPDRYGRPLWYRPPRFTKWQLAGVLCGGFLLFQAGLYLLAVFLPHH